MHRHERLAQALRALTARAQAHNGENLLLNAKREFFNDWSWFRSKGNPYRLAPLADSLWDVHAALDSLAGSTRLDAECRLVSATFDLPLWTRLMFQSIVVEHWGQVVFARGMVMPLSKAHALLSMDEPVVVVEVFGCPVVGDPLAAQALAANEAAMTFWATSLLDGPFGAGTQAAALWAHPVHPDAMVSPSVMNMLSCVAGEHLVRSLGDRRRPAAWAEDVTSVVAESVRRELSEWSAFRGSPHAGSSPRRIPMVWPGIRCWAGTLSEHRDLPDFLSRTTAMPSSLRILAETWWTTRMGEQVMGATPQARVLIRPPAGPPVARIQSLGWAMFQEGAGFVGVRPVNTLRVMSLTDEEWMREETSGVDRRAAAEGVPDAHLAPPSFPAPPGRLRVLRGGPDHCSFSRLEFRDLNDHILARSAAVSTFDIMSEYDAFIDVVRDEHADNSGGRSMVRELTRHPGSTVWVRTRSVVRDQDPPPDNFSASAENPWRPTAPESRDSSNQDLLP
jgi:hypothetical protein